MPLLLMKRQLRKVIFLPANKFILSYIGHSYVPEYQNHIIKKPYFKTRLHKFFKKQSFRKFEISQLAEYKITPSKNIWDAIAYCQTCGFEVILYPDLNTGMGQREITEAFEKLKTKKLATALLKGNTTIDFLESISHFDINPHNSIFVSQDYNLIGQLLEVFYPLNSYHSDELFEKPFGFHFIYWNQPQKTNDEFLIKSKGSENLPLELTTCFPLNNRLFSAKGFPYLIDKIVYIDEGYNEPINFFITENIDWIQQLAQSKGCDFIYLPELIKNQVSSNFVSEYIEYYYPQVSDDFKSKKETSPSNFSKEEIQKLFLNFLNLPAFNSPALLRNTGSISGSSDNEFTLFTFTQEKTIKEQFEAYFAILTPAKYTGRIFYSIAKQPKDGSADSLFDLEAQKLTEDVIQKIEWLKKEGLNGMLTEIAFSLFQNTDTSTIGKLNPRKTSLELPNFNASVISRLRIDWVSKYDFQITLPDYGNRLVEMPRLPKALYYFFLQHPEGVMLNSLADYKDELQTIYERISNKGDKEEIARNINRLVDPLDNSVNVNCSRIKSAFVKLIDERLAKHYYITGWRGEVKKVNLSSELIEIVHVY